MPNHTECCPQNTNDYCTIIFIITMLDLPRQVSIDQYNKILEAENIAKLKEIERLRKQMDLLTLSTHLQHLNETKCKQCLRKEQEIDTLIKAVKALRPDPQTTLLSHAQGTSVSDAGSNNQFEKSFKLSNCRSGDSLEAEDAKSIKKGTEMLSTCYNETEVITHLKLQKNIFLDEIMQLKQKLSEFERKIQMLEYINKKLQRENKSGSEQKSEYGLLPFTVKEQSTHAPSNHGTKKASTMFSKMRINMVNSFMTPTQNQRVEQSQKNQQHATPSFKETNSILQRSIANRPYDFSGRTNILSQKSSARRYKSRDHDLIEERRRSLNHKIKILESENERLRTQVFDR